MSGVFEAKGLQGVHLQRRPATSKMKVIDLEKRGQTPMISHLYHKYLLHAVDTTTRHCEPTSLRAIENLFSVDIVGFSNCRNLLERFGSSARRIFENERSRT